MAEARESKSAFGIPLIVGAIGFGLAAAVMAFIYLKSEKAALLEKYAGANRKEVTVLVAAKDLPKGTTLRQELLSQRRIPSGFVSNDAIPASEYEKYLGRVIETDVGAGKPLLTSYLDTRFPVDFSDLVPIGRRAMTIQVDDLNAIAGFVRPGNRIDLFVTIPSALSGFSAGFITANMIEAIPPELRNAIPASLLDAARTADTSDGAIKDLLANALPKDLILPVLQNVRVLATGRDPYREELDQLAYPQPRNSRNFNTVTIDVTPHEAALVSAAVQKGDLLALLRNRKDEGAAEFSTVSAQDLFGHAFEMSQSEAKRRQRVTLASGVDRAGNLVDADGEPIMTREQLAAAGLTVNDKGELVDKDGRIIKPDDVVVTADGRVVQKSALAAAGLQVNAAGQIVDAQGRPVAADEVVVTRDGKVVTKQQLAAAGLRVDESGEVVDANGKVVDTGKVVVASDGTLLTQEQIAKAGLKLNDKGEIVDANGQVVDPAKLVVGANGQIIDKAKLAAAGLTIDAQGRVIDKQGRIVDAATLVTDANGRIIDKATLEAAGLSLDANGQIVDREGNVVAPENLVVTKDGSLVSTAQLAASGLTVDESGQVVDATGRVLSANEVAAVQTATPIAGASGTGAPGPAPLPGTGPGGTAGARAAAGSARAIGFIIGGAPNAGVAKTTTLKVTE